MRSSTVHVWIIVASLGLSLPLLAADGIEANTKPSGDVKHAFVRPGMLDKLSVEPGQVVKAGQLLAKQDDKAEQAQMEELKANAEDTIRVEASEKQLAVKRNELQKIRLAHKRQGATDQELERAQLDVEIGMLTVKVEKFQREQDARKANQLQHQLDRMSIFSRIDGIVQEVFAKEGEAVDANAKVVRVVCIDPLWVDVPVPVEQTRSLKKGDEVEVLFTESGLPKRIEVMRGGPGKTTSAKGKVRFVAPVAEPSSGTRMVQVEVPNPTSRPAGEWVEVVVPNAGNKVAAKSSEDDSRSKTPKERKD